MSEKHNVLVPLDGSRQALSAVRYISGAMPPGDKHITLFHVLQDLPEAFLDLDVNGSGNEEMFLLDQWRREQRRFGEENLAAARKILVDAGFPAEQVSIQLIEKKVGVARDILAESRKGYSAVVVGRTGNSATPGVPIGSVANKLLAVMHHLPLVIVGGAPESSRILLAFDGSGGSRNCVSCAGALLAHPNREVILCHVIRPLGIHQTGSDFFKPGYEKEWVEANRRRIIPALTQAKDVLEEAGFHSRRITIEILAESVSRAGALVQEAKSRNFGTIIVGRRGLTIVDEMLIGRVSTKVVNLAEDRAVWVVN
jgi:nucleotide-binding universal stress UspA family protein